MVTKKEKDKAKSAETHDKASYYLPKSMVKKIKIEAVQREVTASKLVEEWLRKVMKEEGVK